MIKKISHASLFSLVDKGFGCPQVDKGQIFEAVETTNQLFVQVPANVHFL
jgi:hypothetical protein